MYVCLCNVLSDAQVSQVIRDGARRPREVYAACGCRAQCGACTKTLLGMVRETASANRDVHANQ